jgi:FkbM family methyltransferase
MIQRVAKVVHGALARGPRSLSRLYFEVVGALSRAFLGMPAHRRVMNSLCGYHHPWPAFDFAPRSVVLGKATEIRLIPHIGEFDQQALFSRRLDYEPAVFAWFEENALQYDLIVEIGANVGIYSVFFDALARRRPAGERPRLVAFEPAPRAFERLQRNLAANEATVETHQVAVGDKSGHQTFYEAEAAGRLTNGSLVRSAVANFSPQVKEIVIEVISAADLERWIKPARHALIKIDVEGYEPQLLAALTPLIERYRPDLMIEVLPGTPEALAGNSALAGYERFLVTDAGLRKEGKFYFSQEYFDWLLRWPRK